MSVLEPNDLFQDRGLIKITDGARVCEINTSNELLVTQGALSEAIPFLNQTYEDTSFVVGDSPVLLQFNSDAGRNSVDGYVICDGPGNIVVDFSRDGATYGGAWTMYSGEMIGVRNYDIHTLRITYVADSAYRVNLI